MKFIPLPFKLLSAILFFALILSNFKTIAQPTQATFKGFQFAKFDDEWKVRGGGSFSEMMQHSLKIKFHSKPDSIQLNYFCTQYHLNLRKKSNYNYFYFHLDTTYDLLASLNILDTVSNIAFLAPEILARPCSNSNDTYFNSPGDPGYQWYLDNINIHPAWALTHGSPNVTVAMIGDGIDWEHEDIGPGIGANSYHNLWNNPNDSWGATWPSLPATSAPGDGLDGSDPFLFVDDFLGVNLHSEFSGSPMQKWQVAPYINAHDHSMASVIAAKTNNNIGIAGIAGGWGNNGVKLLTISLAIDYLGGSFNPPFVPYYAEAVDYAVSMGAQIINLSYGVQQSFILQISDG